MKAKKHNSEGIPPTLNSLDGEAITEPTEKANVLNKILDRSLLLKNLTTSLLSLNLLIHLCHTLKLPHKESIIYCMNFTQTNLQVPTSYTLKATAAEISPMLTHESVLLPFF